LAFFDGEGDVVHRHLAAEHFSEVLHLDHSVTVMVGWFN
jgi:hypothetical protein